MPFVIPGLGYKSKLLVCHETTYNTAPAAAESAVELLNMSITPKLSVIEDPSLSATQVSRRFIGQGGQYIEWSARVRVGYEGMLPLVRMFFPTYTQAVVDTSARDHTFKEGLALQSYTLDAFWGDIPVGKVNRLSGVYATTWRIAGQAGTGESAMLTLEIGGVAASLTPNTTPMTTAALPTALGVIYHQLVRTAAAFKDGSNDTSDQIPLKSFELSMEQPHDTSRYLFGQVNAEVPVRNGFFDGTMSFEEEWDSVSLMNACRNNTPTGLLMTFQHPTVIGAATAKREFEIKANSVTASDYGTEVPGFGVITQRAAFRLAYNTGDASLAVVRIRSTEATMPY